MFKRVTQEKEIEDNESSVSETIINITQTENLSNVNTVVDSVATGTSPNEPISGQSSYKGRNSKAAANIRIRSSSNYKRRFPAFYFSSAENDC